MKFVTFCTVYYLQEALEDYTACLPLVPNNNLSMKRDVLEAIVRCYSYLGKSKQALEICETLVGYKIYSDTVIKLLVIYIFFNLELFGAYNGSHL